MKTKPEEIRQFISHLPKRPKMTKEQKIVCKALEHISAAMLSTDKKFMSSRLNYACGLLEALVFQDDKESEE